MAETKNTKKKTTTTDVKKGNAKKVTTTKASTPKKSATKTATTKKVTATTKNTTPKATTAKKSTEAPKKTAANTKGNTKVATKVETTKKVQGGTTNSKTKVDKNTQEKSQVKKTAKVATTKKSTTTRKQPVVEEPRKIIKPIELNIEPKVVEPIVEDVKESAVIEQDNKEEIVKSENAIDSEEVRERKINKRIDVGILTVIIGLFVLVLTTYLSSEIDLSIDVTRILVIASLVIEAIGMIVMIVNIWKRK